MNLTDIPRHEFLAVRFWAKVVPGEEVASCREYQGTRNRAGYGRVSVGTRTERRMVFAHRVAYLLTHGSLTAGLEVCHTCDNPQCCNPNHLDEGTRQDNARDMHDRGRWRRTARQDGAANPNARLTAEQVSAIRRLYPGASQAALAERFGVTQSMVSRIVRGAAWQEEY